MHQRLIAAAALVALAAGCAGPATLPTSGSLTQPASPITAIAPHAPCPVPGTTIVKGKSSAKLESTVAYTVLGTRILRWTVTFKGQSSSAAPVAYTAKLFACGGAQVRKPIGTVADTGGGSTQSSCHNGVCTVEVTYVVSYKPPAKTPSNKPWKYDLIRFDPAKPKPPYGVMPGILVEVRKAP